MSRRKSSGGSSITLGNIGEIQNILKNLIRIDTEERIETTKTSARDFLARRRELERRQSQRKADLRDYEPPSAAADAFSHYGRNFAESTAAKEKEKEKEPDRSPDRPLSGWRSRVYKKDDSQDSSGIEPGAGGEESSDTDDQEPSSVSMNDSTDSEQLHSELSAIAEQSEFGSQESLGAADADQSGAGASAKRRRSKSKPKPESIHFDAEFVNSQRNNSILHHGISLPIVHQEKVQGFISQPKPAPPPPPPLPPPLPPPVAPREDEVITKDFRVRNRYTQHYEKVSGIFRDRRAQIARERVSAVIRPPIKNTVDNRVRDESHDVNIPPPDEDSAKWVPSKKMFNDSDSKNSSKSGSAGNLKFPRDGAFQLELPPNSSWSIAESNRQTPKLRLRPIKIPKFINSEKTQNQPEVRWLNRRRPNQLEIPCFDKENRPKFLKIKLKKVVFDEVRKRFKLLHLQKVELRQVADTEVDPTSPHRYRDLKRCHQLSHHHKKIL